MSDYRRASTGLPGLDRVVDELRLGDNIVWQVDAVADYRAMVAPYLAQARADGRHLVYVRFARHEPLLDDVSGVSVREIPPEVGFEAFAHRMWKILEEEGRGAFYVFDCLTDLLDDWYSDLTVMNLFKVTCPFLFDLDAVAYFAFLRHRHSVAMIAGIRETTQLLLDLHVIDGTTYVHPLKVWGRHSPTMFFPHAIDGAEATSITSSAQSARLFAAMGRPVSRPDHWHVLLDRGWAALEPGVPDAEREQVAELVRAMIIDPRSRMAPLCARYLDLPSLLAVAARETGTGYIGGKSVGMLVARAILEAEPDGRFAPRLEPHDSYYLGADLFYTYIVANGWWRLWTTQRTPSSYFSAGAQLRELLGHGRFPPAVQEQFLQMLEHFGQSPIIVRSSSLLEDNFGNAFAGKYDSVFCANQGSPEERYHAFEDAVRRVYASAMSEEALAYRASRGLVDRDEQMAILVQRVSGDHHGEVFFPHAAGVGNSSNLYVWAPDVDMDAGMIRLVFGLGTRAVDRSVRDYARIVALDEPTRGRLSDPADLSRYSQRGVDVLSLTHNDLRAMPLTELVGTDIGADWSLFASPDQDVLRRLAESGRRPATTPQLLDFRGLLADTDFAATMRDMLATISAAYDYPVDIEFTVNIPPGRPGTDYQINLVQCRPLQTRGLGRSVAMPELDPSACLLASVGNFMGGNVRLPIEYVVLVRPEAYLLLDQEGRYAVARLVGALGQALAGSSYMLIGPGRWGTTTPSLGVPVRFAEIRGAAVLVEVTYPDGEFRPELSYGSHFFQDLVETGIFYAALFVEREEVTFNAAMIVGRDNELTRLVDSATAASLAGVVHVARLSGVELFADIRTQQLICR